MEKVVVESIKPAAGFVTALLGPKIELVKKWVEDRELQGKFAPDALASVMQSYLQNLAETVSEITSIAFSHKKTEYF